MRFKHLLVFVFAIASSAILAQPYQVRIAFMGNSITIGSGLANPERDRYPSQLAAMLQQVYGDTIAFENFAVTGRTMLKHGDVPIWEEVRFDDFVNYGCNLCFILMGTNDSKPQNWNSYSGEFIGDYLSMMDTIKQRNPYVKFIICYPPPAFDVVWGIRNTIIYNEVIPAIDSIQKLTGATLVDFYHPLVDSVSLFPDKIHPNERGAKAMAKIAFDKIMETDLIHQVETGLTFVTRFKTDKPEICQGDSAVLTWTTYNADSVYMNGRKVDNNGTRKINPAQTTTFQLIAYGAKYTDTLDLEQKVYLPYLYKILVDPNKHSITNGQPLRLHASYFDQNSVLMDTTIATQWAIIEGEGELTEITDSAVTFIPKINGKTKVTATVGDITGKSTITVEGLGMQQIENDNLITIYPNPATNWLTIEDKKATIKKVEILNILGQPLVNQSKINTTNYRIDVSDLPAGVYFLRITDANNNLQTLRVNK